MKKRTRKLLTMVCCAVALVVISVGATLAYLTDTESVTNTFTVGNVNITLDELKTGTDGVPVTPNERISGNRENENYTNKYHLLPGESYTKDPTVHVEGKSEDSYIFVKVENGLTSDNATIEDSSNTIATQIANNGWTALNGVDNVYYKEYTQQDTVKDLVVFSSFTIADSVDGETLADYADAEVVITAYAIQKAGFNTAADAWASVTSW